MLPNAIICGAQKAGTTSVFRYLSVHPSVCSSKKKEIHYFINNKNEMPNRNIKEYEKYFSHCLPNQYIRIEASPLYLMESQYVAEKLHKIIPDCKLIFILREPISLLISYIKFKSNISTVNYPIEMFADLAKGVKTETCQEKYNVETQNAKNHLEIGCYIKHIENYLAYFPIDQIGIFFFDELSSEPLVFMKRLCVFLGISGDFYNEYQFAVENKTRYYKFPGLHRLIVNINTKLEIVFNRFPELRNNLRNLYISLFETAGKNEEILPSTKLVLKNYYMDSNKSLSQFLVKNYSYLKLPKWLKER